MKSMMLWLRSTLVWCITLGLGVPSLAAPLLGEDFPTLPKATLSLGTWELQPGPDARTYTRADIDRLGLFSLHDLLSWDGVVDISDQWGPWVGDGISMDGRSTQGCVLILFNGHPLSTPSSNVQTTLRAFSLKRATRVDILIGTTAGLYGEQGCDLVVSVIDDGREPGFVLDTSWQSLSGANISGMLRRKLADLTMSAGVTFQTLDEPLSTWKSFRDLEKGVFRRDLSPEPQWVLESLSDALGEDSLPRGQAYTYDFFYRVEVGDFRLSWNNSALSTHSARGLEPGLAVYGDDFETSSQESLYLSYVTDAEDGSWRFYWNMSYGLSSIAPDTELRSALGGYAPQYSYRDEKTLVLEEYMLWELASWASLFVGGGAGFGVVSPRTALLSEPIDIAGPIDIMAEDEPYAVATQISYRTLFGYGHLTFGASDGPRLQLGGRFDSDSRDELVIRPRVSLALPLTTNLAWTTSGEVSQNALSPRRRYLGERVVREDAVVWARSPADDLEKPQFCQLESAIEHAQFQVKAYYRQDAATSQISLSAPVQTTEFKERKTIGWSLESFYKNLHFNAFLMYRGWASELDSWLYGHRVTGRTRFTLGGFDLAQSVWVQHGDTLGTHPWSGGAQAALSRSLDHWYEGLRIWARAHLDVRKSRMSLQADSLVPLPPARVGGQSFGTSLGLELRY